MSDEPLAHRVIAIAEARELDLFSALLERRGARVLRYPLIQIIDAPDPQRVLQWLHAFIGDSQELILLTGEGLRRLLSCIDAHEPALRDPFLKALARVRKITRGPKPARALRQLGLETDLAASQPTTAGVIEALRALELAGRQVDVQLYGEEPNQPLMDFLQQAGAKVRVVAPYRYANSASDSAVRELLARMRGGEIDAIAFTSKAQVERLFAVDSAAAVCAALAATQVAVVGPVVAAALATKGVPIQAMPEHSWFMKPLTAALTELLRVHPLQKT